jgi:hypothetical protein
MTEFDAEALHNAPQWENPFGIVAVTDKDSQGTEKWKEFLNRDRLLDA